MIKINLKDRRDKKIYTLLCEKCGVSFSVKRHRIYNLKQNKYRNIRFCSSVCRNSVSGVLGGRAGKGVSRNVGNKRPDLALRNTVVVYRGADSPFWKGEKIGYGGIHSWIRNKMGRATKCCQCGSTKHVQWANKDKKYTRDIETWMTLCAQCHHKYDKNLRHIKSPFLKTNRSIRLPLNT